MELYDIQVKDRMKILVIILKFGWPYIEHLVAQH